MISGGKKVNLRHEYKYLISFGAYLQLRQVLKKVMNMDDNSLDGEGYHIRSLYFDDIYDTALVEKSMGIANRKKFRIRIYNYSDELIKLEEKIKQNSYIHKNALNITKAEYEKICRSQLDFLLNSKLDLMNSYYIQMTTKLLRPKVIVDYIREAYVLPFNQIRITFDRNLSAGEPVENIFDKDLCTYQTDNGHDVILEVKYNNFLPSHIRSILEIYCTNRSAVSKYVICREYLLNR